MNNVTSQAGAAPCGGAAATIDKHTVRRAIVEEDRRLRAKYKFLEHQNAIGGTIIVASVLWIAGCAAAYGFGLLPSWLTVMAIAFAMSMLHEIEHDLIHNLYFAGSPRLQKAVYNLIWLVKMHVNPAWRKKVHLRHHAYSGQNEDWEERLLGMGAKMGFKRMLAILHPFGPAVFVAEVAASDSKYDRETGLRANGPTALLFTVLSTLGLCHLLLPAAWHAQMTDGFWHAVAWLNVVWVLPAMLRHTAITTITTMSHYGGDIPRGEVLFENQILDHWAFIPLQLFCANFGANHILHHYVVVQPFYLRHAVSAKVKPVLLAAGVRHNDLGILSRANRWNVEVPKAA